MFGWLYLSAKVVNDVCEGISERVEDGKNRTNRIIPDKMVYVDSRNRLRDVVTNQVVLKHINADGDVLICDTSGNVLRNLGERERNIQKLEQDKLDTTIYKLSYGKITRYFDKKTNAEYVIEKHEGFMYYVDAKTKLLVRPTDEILKYYDGNIIYINSLYNAIKKVNDRKNRWN